MRTYDIMTLDIDKILNQIENKLLPVNCNPVECEHTFEGSRDDIERGYRCTICRFTSIEIIKIEIGLRERQRVKNESENKRIKSERDSYKTKLRDMSDKFTPVLQQLQNTASTVENMRISAVPIFEMAEEIDERRKDEGGGDGGMANGR